MGIHLLSDGIVKTDRKFRIKEINEGFTRLSGFKEEEVKGKSLEEFLSIPGVPEKKPVSGIEGMLKTKEEAVLPVLVSVMPEKEGYVFTLRNVYEYVYLLKRLAEERNFMEAILESIAEGVFTIDREWRITSCNRAFEEITGYKREEVIGKKCGDVIRSSECGKECPLRRAMEKREKVTNREVVIKRKDGKRIPVSVNATILYDASGEAIGVVETLRDLSEIKRLMREVSERYRFGNLIGKSREMQRVYEKLEIVAPTDSNVLIVGETGTGKDLVARMIHYNSKRKNKPFVKINCAAIPENLLESELFGYKKGAFTGAVEDKPGKFELADGGTIFLDEIGDMSLSLQAKLLRVIEEKEFERLGDVETRKVDVRIIAATHRDLRKLMEEGRFREDLFYRLNVVTIYLPPLRERIEDIPLLVDHFIKQFSQKMGKEVKGVEEDVMDFFIDYPWPGNVRELEHVIEHAMIHAKGAFIKPSDLPEYLFEKEREGKKIEDVEREHIERILREVGWSMQKASKALGISRTTLWRKIKKYGIKKPE